MSRVALISRYGAYGDNIILSCVIDGFHKQGWKVIFDCGKRGAEVYKHDERIAELIPHDESIKDPDKLLENIKELRAKVKHDYYCHFSGSIEHNVCAHPTQPEYIYPKYEREKIFNRNYYEATIKWAEEKGEGEKPDFSKFEPVPSLRFTTEEEEKVKKWLNPDRKNVLWALSGSGCNKVYPWTEYVMQNVIAKEPVHFITVGDNKCQMLENFNEFIPKETVTNLAGLTTIRESLLLTKFVDLVVSPDTGVLHASGCWETPKIGLLGHTTRVNITKHFKSDYSLESDSPCAPCFYLIYDHSIQCPLDYISHSAWCMSIGLDGERVTDRIVEVLRGKGN
jgi:ADP-heptose:LPS heptosyltransferase